MCRVDIAWGLWEEAVAKDCHLLFWGVNQDVVSIAEGWEGVDLLAFLCFGQGPDVLGFSGMMEVVVGPLTFGIVEDVAEGLGCCVSGCPSGCSACGGVGGDAVIIPPVNTAGV